MENIDIDKYVNLRRELHSKPEKSGEEFKTVQLIKETLKNLPEGNKLEINTVSTLVVVDLVGEKESSGENKIIGFRGDIDGLPLTEETDLPYKSAFEGRMHACGHDGHIVILLGTIEHLLGRIGEIDKNLTLRFLFQPAQETRQGAKLISKHGFLTGMTQCFALQNTQSYDLGTIGLIPKAMFSKSINFNIKVNGKGGHSSMPDECRNPLLVVADLVEAIYTIPANSISPAKHCVISVGKVDCGSKANIIPEYGAMGGNARVFDEEDAKTVKERIRTMAVKLAEAADCSAEVSFTEGKIVFNDPETTELVSKIALKEHKISSEGLPAFVSEDFGIISAKVPSCLFILGTADNSHRESCHSPKYDFNDAAIPSGIKMFTQIAETFFSK